MYRKQKSLQLIIAFVLSCLLAIAYPAGLMAQSDAPPNVDDVTDTSVQLGPIPLFEIESELGSFSQQERADAITQRLRRLLRDNKVSAEQIKAIPKGEGVQLSVNDQVIMLVTNEDAEKAGKSAEALANEHIRKIKAGLEEYELTYGNETLLSRGLIAGGITLVFLLILGLLQLIVPRIHRQILSLKGKKIRTLTFQSLDLLSEDQIAHVLILMVNLIKFVLRLGLIYLFLLSVLGLFPKTQFLAKSLVVYVVLAFQTIWFGFVDYLPNLVFIIIIALITFYSIRFIQFVCSALEGGLIGFPGFDQEWARPTYQIVRFLVIAAAITLAIPYLPGSSSPAVQGMSIFFGILVSLGSTAVVANVVAGLALTYTRAFRIGDRVKIADTIGDVIEKTFLVTQIRTPKNMIVTIPNGMVLSDQIINYSANEKDQGLILHTQVTLGYDVPWQKVHRVLIESAIATADVLNDPEPFVLQKGLEDFYVAYELNAYTLSPMKMTRIYSELHQNIQDACNENDIEILSPHYSAVRDGNETTIPESYRESSYEPPGFRFHGFNLMPKVVRQDPNQT